MECEAMPVGHVRQADRQSWEDCDPNHLFEDTYCQAQWQDAGCHGEQACPLDIVSEQPPEYPADGSEKKIMDAPGCHQKPEGDANMAVPGVHADPLLQPEQEAREGECSPQD